jgi:hypothetical protein
MIYENYDPDNKFLNKWYMQYRQGFGVAEWRDDGDGKVIVFAEPIGWGNVEEIGSTYQNHPVTDPWQCIPTMLAKATQTIKFEALHDKYTTIHGDTYDNVLEISYMQSWGSTNNGAKYWFAKGVGPIALQFIIQDTKDKSKYTLGPVMEAKVTEIPRPF